MPPKRGPKSTSRKNTPVSPPKPASSTAGSPKQTRRSGRGVSRDNDELEVQRGSVELGLEPVVELDEDAVAAAQLVGVPESPPGSEESDHSSITQGELDGLDYDFIVESLADLHREALKIIEIFTDHSLESFEALAAELNNATSRASKRFRYDYGKMSSTFGRFDTGKRIYIIPETIVRKLEHGDAWSGISDGKWRPDAILYLANLAQLLATTFLGDEDSLDTYFDALIKYFPRVFTSQSDGSRFATAQINQREDFDKGFRTQLFIHIARRDSKKPSYDPGDALTELFLVETEPRVTEINKFITTNSKNPVKIEAITKAFPWPTYLIQVVDWVVARAAELQAQIATQGGIDRIVQCIEDADYSPLGYQQALPVVSEQPFPLDPDLPGVTEQPGRWGLGSRTFNPSTMQEMRKLKAMEAARQAADELSRGSGQPESAAVGVGGAFQVDAPRNDDIHLEQGPPPADEDDAEARAQTSLVLQTIAHQAQESNKENINSSITRQVSLLDRQPNARKVPFSDTQSPGKRQRATDDTDDDFEQDQRPAQQVRRGRPPRASQAIQATPGPSGQLPASQPAHASTPAEAHVVPPSTAPPRSNADNADNTEIPRSSQWEDANREAKITAKFNRERVLDTKVQNRKPWTQDEVNRLMELIELNGPGYSKILQDDGNPEYYPEGPVLHGRSQVQLKDKARNMKLDFIKARHRLPPGFSQVSIGKRHVEILRNNFNIDYIGGDGRGVNLGVMEGEE